MPPRRPRLAPARSLRSIENPEMPHEEAHDRLLDYIDYGIICATSSAFIVYSNRSARSLIDACSGLAVKDSHLVCDDHRETVRLHGAINAVAMEGVPRLVTVSSATGRLHLSVVPLNGNGADARADVAIFLGPRQSSPSLSLHWFGIDCGLTSAERTVLAALSEGLDPRAVAHSCGVAVSTVRTQIASIRDKTGSPSTSALMREVARLPPVLPPPRLGVVN
jgi:DNA-binding CsgD family transcriptional regulator